MRSGAQRTATVAAMALCLVVLVAGIAAILLPRLAGIELRNVRSASMEPAFEPGDLLIAAPVSARDVREGDVLVFRDKTRDLVVSHRVVRVIGEGDETLFRTKGDANSGYDVQLVAPDEVLGKVRFDIPNAGRWAERLRSPLGSFLLVLLPSTALVALEVRSWRRFFRERSPSAPAPLRKRVAAPALSLPLMLAVALVIAAAALVGMGTYALRDDDRRDRSAADPQTVAMHFAASVDGAVALAQTEATRLAADPVIASAAWDDRRALEGALQGLRASAVNRFGALALVGADGAVVASTRPAVETTSDSAAFLLAAARRDVAASPMRTERGAAFLDYAVPMFGPDAGIRGYLLARIEPDVLWGDALAADVGGTANAVIDRSGVHVAGAAIAAVADGCGAVPVAVSATDLHGWRVVACDVSGGARATSAVRDAVIAGIVALIVLGGVVFTVAWLRHQRSGVPSASRPRRGYEAIETRLRTMSENAPR
jgi:signal peptidase